LAVRKPQRGGVDRALSICLRLRRDVKKLLILGAAVVAIGLAWWLTPLREWLTPERLLASADAARGSPVAVALVPGAFVALSFAFVPIVVLRATIVLVFGPLLGPLLAILGVALAALAGHAIGQLAGARALERLGGPRVEKVRARLSRAGVLSIAAVRMVPLAPNMVVNAVAGAARVPRRAFVAGTVLGLMPGLILLVTASAPLEAVLRAVS
jgi:phospholipase D1/2